MSDRAFHINPRTGEVEFAYSPKEEARLDAGLDAELKKAGAKIRSAQSRTSLPKVMQAAKLREEEKKQAEEERRHAAVLRGGKPRGQYVRPTLYEPNIHISSSGKISYRPRGWYKINDYTKDGRRKLVYAPLPDSEIPNRLRALKKPKKPKNYDSLTLEERLEYLDALKRHKLAQRAAINREIKRYWDSRRKIEKFEERDRARKQRKYEKAVARQAEREAHRTYMPMVREATREMRRAQTGRITRTAFAGLSPWDPNYGEFKALSDTGYKEYHDKVRNPKKKTIHLANGTTAEVIDSELGVPLGFSQMYGYRGASDTFVGDDGISSTQYATEAFDGSSKNSKATASGGHITSLEYNEDRQLLKVDFTSGNSVIYYRVPSTVAAELLHFAETGQTMISPATGKQRHVLGIRFWDLIRIRGTRTGSTYRFEYGDTSYEAHGTVGAKRKRKIFSDKEAHDKLTKLFNKSANDTSGEFQISTTGRGNTFSKAIHGDIDDEDITGEDYTETRHGSSGLAISTKSWDIPEDEKVDAIDEWYDSNAAQMYNDLIRRNTKKSKAQLKELANITNELDSGDFNADVLHAKMEGLYRSVYQPKDKDSDYTQNLYQQAYR